MNETNSRTELELLEQLLGRFQIIDLSHTLEENIPAWPTHARFFHNLVESYIYGDISCHYQLVMSEHSGTHVDSPLHYIASGKAHYGIERIPLTTFFGRAVTIQATDIGANGLLSREYVEQWEASNGAIRERDIVLIRFGWDRLWALRPDSEGFLSDWPGVGEDAAQYFVEKRVKMVGSDTLALDVYNTKTHPAHYTLLGNEVLIMENLTNLHLLPPFSFFMGFPLKIRGGSGSPIRALAFV